MHEFNCFGAFSMAADVEIKSYALRTLIINGMSQLYGDASYPNFFDL